MIPQLMPLGSLFAAPKKMQQVLSDQSWSDGSVSEPATRPEIVKTRLAPRGNRSLEPTPSCGRTCIARISEHILKQHPPHFPRGQDIHLVSLLVD